MCGTMEYAVRRLLHTISYEIMCICYNFPLNFFNYFQNSDSIAEEIRSQTTRKTFTSRVNDLYEGVTVMELFIKSQYQNGKSRICGNRCTSFPRFFQDIFKRNFI